MLLVVATATFTGVKNEILLAAYVGTHVIHTRVYIRDHPSSTHDAVEALRLLLVLFLKLGIGN